MWFLILTPCKGGTPIFYMKYLKNMYFVAYVTFACDVSEMQKRMRDKATKRLKCMDLMFGNFKDFNIYYFISFVVSIFTIPVISCKILCL